MEPPNRVAATILLRTYACNGFGDFVKSNWRYGAVLIDQHHRYLKEGLDNSRGGNRLQVADRSIMRFLAQCPGLSRLFLGICPLPLFSVAVALGAGRDDLHVPCFGMS